MQCIKKAKVKKLSQRKQETEERENSLATKRNMKRRNKKKKKLKTHAHGERTSGHRLCVAAANMPGGGISQTSKQNERGGETVVFK